jgi:predicted transposase/invertase (TIGR01784 family)
MDSDIKAPGELDLLPPSDDGIFKSLLTRPESKPILADVISSVLNIPVTNVEVRDAELPIEDVDEKQRRFDVNCLTSDGKQVDVEMQAKRMEGDTAGSGNTGIRRRSVYYASALHAAQGKGKSYNEFSNSYQIMFCGYTVFPKREKFISRFRFLEEDEHFELSDSVGIVFIELSKLGKILKKPIAAMTPAEMWSIFFWYADSTRHSKLLREINTAKGEIKMATEILQTISRDPNERARYLSRLKFERDTEHNLIEARKGGRADVAKNLLRRGRPIAEIADDTGFTIAEIERLRDNSQ